MSAGAALRTTAEERLRAGRAQPAPGAARALRVVSILGLLRWLVVEGVSSSARLSDRRAIERRLWLGAAQSKYLARWRGRWVVARQRNKLR